MKLGPELEPGAVNRPAMTHQMMHRIQLLKAKLWGCGFESQSFNVNEQDTLLQSYPSPCHVFTKNYKIGTETCDLGLPHRKNIV